MFLDKFKKLKEMPLEYWEEKSYINVIPENENKDITFGIYDRISSVEGVSILDKRDMIESENKPGYIKVSYLGKEYEIEYTPGPFRFFNTLLINAHRFLDEEVQKLKNSRKALKISMKFSNDVKNSYHLQLKIAEAIVPDLVAILDESAERIYPARWVRMATKAKTVPSPSNLYSVQAVEGKDGEVWLHTHGLCRCGLTELEVLGSNKENYNNHYNLLSTYALYLIDKIGLLNYNEGSVYLGKLIDGTAINVTCRSWTKALKEYKSLSIGGLKDRKDGHNTRTSAIFIYKNIDDEAQGKISKVTEYDKLWGDNPIFLISNEETDRMKAIAIEYFDYVKEQFKDKENKIIIKIGIPSDKENFSSLEHIWFELLEIDGNKFKARLTQEPYYISNMHKGYEDWFNVEDITDWIIYTKNGSVNPDNVFKLACL